MKIKWQYRIENDEKWPFVEIDNVFAAIEWSVNGNDDSIGHVAYIFDFEKKSLIHYRSVIDINNENIEKTLKWLEKELKLYLFDKIEEINKINIKKNMLEI